MVQKYKEVPLPASAAASNEALNALGVDEGIWVAKFWTLYNGALLDDQVLIYSAEQVVERNITYEIDKDFPGQLLVGDDSGGRLVLIDRSVENKFYLIDSGDPFLGGAEIFSSVDALVAHVLGETNALPDSVDIVAIGKVKITPQEVLAIKSELGLSESVAKLKEKLEKENQMILKGVKAVKYTGVFAQYRHLIRFNN
ncbi:hypothetical protein NL64_23260 [Pseudomonas fluorescens]|uniref:hypothetical protein n=1 Tax=Pseudomonas fluorescens TaxID=294 RepID=UPI00054BAFC7|nr:hypothetical protein [Pseudomonas fluorescens]KII28711.1 hypothetical protein NL64_23260 [Pseudomonas fluorescens]